MGDSFSAYSDKDRRRAIIVSALLGWTGVTVMELYGANRSQLLFYLPFFAVIGLPIAFLTTWVIGGPIIRRVMRRPVGWLRAAFAGATVATILAAISIVIGRLNGLRAYNDPTFHYRLGAGEYTSAIDGILTPYGWLLVARNTALFVALGTMIGLIVRVVIGPGQRVP
ncbi:MAG: hypothetical protein B7Z10_12425 [Rhodobacterales bacterium 32-66-7]|nr:MAG: hypothetical protein B7Z10_12425 [Rhodobacterales bacterium 32-66-7]